MNWSHDPQHHIRKCEKCFHCTWDGLSHVWIHDRLKRSNLLTVTCFHWHIELLLYFMGHGNSAIGLWVWTSDNHATKIHIKDYIKLEKFLPCLLCAPLLQHPTENHAKAPNTGPIVITFNGSFFAEVGRWSRHHLRQKNIREKGVGNKAEFTRWRMEGYWTVPLMRYWSHTGSELKKRSVPAVRAHAIRVETLFMH